MFPNLSRVAVFYPNQITCNPLYVINKDQKKYTDDQTLYIRIYDFSVYKGILMKFKEIIFLQ